MRLKLVVKSKLLVILLIGLKTFTFAQDIELSDQLGIQSMVPASPSVAAFNQYGNFPVDLAFGTPNIKIPLHTAKSGDILLPVSISYHAGGIKVNNPGSWLGIGWNINAGGVISRQTNGKPDDIHDGWLKISDEVKTKVLNGITVEEDYDILRNIGESGDENSYDLKPDIFSYSIQGYSGKFMFNEHKELILIPHRNVKITPFFDATYGFIKSFLIELPDGNKYTFTERETTTVLAGMFKNIPEHGSAWYLTRIENMKGNDFIEISYNTLEGPEVFYIPEVFLKTYTQNIGGLYNPEGGNLSSKISYTNLEIDEKSVNEIKSANSILKFFYKNSGRNIDYIEIQEPNRDVRQTIQFSLSDFPNATDCSGSLCTRFKLDRVQKGDQIWEFTYEDIAEPPLNSMDKDHWGYFNGANNSTSPIPDVRPFGGYQIYGDGANRNTNPDKIKFGSLNRIDYPTGGYTIFKFGANKISLVNERGEIRHEFKDIYVKTLTSNTTETTTLGIYNNWGDRSFFVDVDLPVIPTWYPRLELTIEVITDPSIWSTQGSVYAHEPYFLMTKNNIMYNSWYKEISNLDIFEDSYYDVYDNKYIYRTSDYRVFGYNEYNDSELGDTEIKLSISEGSTIKCTLERDGYYLEEASEQNANMFVGGLRIEAIENYDENGNLTSKRIYNYTKPENPVESSAKLLFGTLEDLMTNGMYYYTVGGDQVWAEGCVDHSQNMLVINDNPFSSFVNGWAVVAYDYVTEEKVDTNNKYLGKTEYSFINNLGIHSAKDYPPIPFSNETWNCGMPKDIDIYNADNELLKKTHYTYGYKALDILNAISVSKNRNYDWTAYYCCLNIGECNADDKDLARYAYSDYQITSLWKEKNYEVTTEYIYDYNILQDIITKSNSYDYSNISEDGWILPKKISTTTSNGETIATENLYQFELGSLENLPKGLVREQKKYIEEGIRPLTKEKVISAQSIDYLHRSNKMLNLYKWESNFPDENFTDLTVDYELTKIRDDNYNNEPTVHIKYNINDRPVQVETNNGSITSYIWGYNNIYPIAKIENATYDEIEEIITQTDFETLNNTEVTESTVRNILNKLRSNLPSAGINIYTYDIIDGMLSQTDPNGFISYFKYDDYGKLINISDHNNNILKEYVYHYQGQPVDEFTGYYQITTQIEENGRIDPEYATVKGGDDLTLKVIPDEFYHVKDVKINGISQGILNDIVIENITNNKVVSVEFGFGPIIISKSGNGIITLDNETSVLYGSDFIYSFTPGTGYYIKDVVVDGVSIGIRRDYTFEDVTSAHTLYVEFSNIYLVHTTVIYNEGGSFTPANPEVVYGDNVHIRISADEGYYIYKITYEEVPIEGLTETTTGYTILVEDIQHHVGIDAEFRIKTFDITASKTGSGTITSEGTTTYNYGSSKTYYFTPDANHHVKDVKVDGVSQGAITNYTFSDINANHDILVEFEIDSYPITVTKSGSGTISPSGDISVNHGSDLTFNFTPSTGYYIKSVIVDGVSVTPRSPYTFTNVTGPHTLQVEFSNIYLVHTTVIYNEGGSFTPANPEVVYGDNVHIRISADEGYYIYKITYEEVPIEGLTETTTGYTILVEDIQHHVGIDAEFRIKTFDITASKTGSGTITPEGTTTYNYGSSKTYTFTPATGYHVSDVKVDGVSQGALGTYTFSNISADHTISVVFAINTYTITATKTGSGTMTPSGNSTVNYNGSITYSFAPSTGYYIKDVKVNGVSKGSISSYTFNYVKSNQTLSIEFAIKTYTIFTSTNSGGLISPANPVVNYNSDVTVIAMPSSGYYIFKVILDEIAVTNFLSTKYLKAFNDVTSNHSLYVEFKHNPVTITASQSGNGTITPSGTISIEYGSSKAYSFAPASGYYIKNVKVNGVSKGAISSYTFSNVTSNQTVWVEFAQSPYINTSVSGLGFTETGGTKTFTISSNVSWTISSDVTWFTVTPVSGTNNATITVNCSSMPIRYTERSGTITITGGGITKLVYISQWQEGVILD